MPHKCCVPNCDGNRIKGPKVHVFGFPKDANLCEKWIAAIPKVNFAPTKHSKVCEIHFSEGSIVRSISRQDSRTGKVVTASLNVPRLQNTAVPTIFPTCPEYSSMTVTIPENREEELVKVEETKLIPALEQKEHTYYYNNYDEFLTVFGLLKIQDGWFTINDKEKITLFKMMYTPGPVVSYAIVINSNLKVETFLYGQKISVSVNNANDTFRTPFVSRNLDQIKDLQEQIDADAITKDSCSRHGDSIKSILNHVSNILDSLRDEEDDSLSFISEQIKLHSYPKGRYRYSNTVMIFSAILFKLSPHAYTFFRNTGILILPHPTTLITVCNTFLTNPNPNARQTFLTYARNMFQCLDEKGRFVILLMDKIHIQSYRCGNIVDRDNKVLLTAAYAFTITSIYSDFKKVIHISPTSKISHDKLHQFIKIIIINLEQIGYRVFCVVSDNNAINNKAMSSFAQNNKLSIVYPHPISSNRPLFFLYDPIYLLKFIKISWLNSKPNQVLTYPDFETGSEKLAMFDSLKKLQELKHDKLLNFDYSVNLKALFPSNLEKQNALKIFNPFMVQALLQFGTNVEKSKDTADFIDIIVRWWKIINVKTTRKEKCLKDVYQEPILAINLMDPKLEFLQKMLNWLDVWKTGQFSHKLSSETLNGLCHTIHGMLEITKYCFCELGMNSILLGKFQTNSLEQRFRKDRQLAEGQYYVSVRQLYESKRLLRIQSILILKSRTFGNIPINMFPENVELNEENVEISFSSRVNVDTTDFEQVTDEMPVIIYLGGYCCHVTLEKLKCELCRPKLVYSEELVVEDSYNLIKNLYQGMLRYPHDTVVKIVSYVCVIFNKLLQDLEDEFLKAPNKKNVLSQLVLKYLIEERLLCHFHGCQNHSEEYVVNILINSITDTLLQNYYVKKNDQLDKNRKRKLCAVEWGYLDQI